MKAASKYILLSLWLWLFVPNATAQFNTERIQAIGRNALYFDDYVLSIQYFNQIIKVKPHLYEPYLLRGIAKIQLGDYQGALRDLNASIERNPFQPGAYYTRGYVYRQMNDYDHAEEDFSKALDFSPENTTYLILRADVRSAKKEYEEALADIDFLIRRSPKSASLYFEKGVICLAKADTMCAYEAFSETVKYDSQNSSNWSALGLVNLIRGEEDEALKDLTKSINLGSKWAGDYTNRGIIHYRRHNYVMALSDYDHAVQLAPNDKQALYNRGALRTEVGDYNNALEDLKRVIELDQYYLPAYYTAAHAERSMRNKKEAERYIHLAQELAAQYDSLNALSADPLLAQSKPQQRDRRKEFSTRVAQSQTGVEEAPQFDSETRGQIQHKQVDVINIPNINDSIYEALNELTDTTGVNFMQIMNQYDQLIAAAPTSPFHYYNKANVLCIMRLFEDAVTCYTQAISLDNEFAEAYFNRGLTYIYIGQNELGIQDLSRAGELGIYQAYNLITRFQ